MATQGSPMAGERGSTPGRRDSERIVEKVALGSGWRRKPREDTLTRALDLNYVCDPGQATWPG